MCLGIVGQIVALPKEHPDLAQVEVAGMTRNINIGILHGETLNAGDWILIHAGFAMEKIDEETARNQMSALQDYTGADAELGEIEFAGFDDDSVDEGDA
jgi:hydrogenase expression/formation protein HypC